MQINRLEVKVPLDYNQYLELPSILNNLGVYPRRQYSDRWVNSIYLDSLALTNYLENVIGLSNRQKIRFRWYDSLEQISIERKQKTNKSSNKQSAKLSNIKALRPDHAVAIGQLELENPQLLAYTLSLAPTLEVSYLRSYYEIASGIRMTIDRNMKFRSLSHPADKKMTNSPVASVVEFKY
ncbi:MAG: VTC domain-containing protein, partial [Gammaproteobacteria bacterium]|nr:VTC domain-containing protein [Gammaproteobacteria bacterium]